MHVGPTTTRDERLAWNADAAIALIRGAAPQEEATVALAMFDQLEMARMGPDAVEMAVMFWSRALDGLDPGPVPPERLRALDDDLGLLAAGAPVLARWMAALRGIVATAHDLDWVIRFLMEVRQTWHVTARFR